MNEQLVDLYRAFFIWPGGRLKRINEYRYRYYRTDNGYFEYNIMDWGKWVGDRQKYHYLKGVGRWGGRKG
jgi:hypothetical protein